MRRDTGRLHGDQGHDGPESLRQSRLTGEVTFTPAAMITPLSPGHFSPILIMVQDLSYRPNPQISAVTSHKRNHARMTEATHTHLPCDSQVRLYQ